MPQPSSPYRRRPFSSRRLVLPLLSFACLLLAFANAVPCRAAGTITGTVFRDFNANGLDDGAFEPGLGGVSVTAFDAAGAVAGSTTTCSATGVPGPACTLANLGSYELVVSGSGPYRLEFSGLPAAYASGPAGSGSGTTVQFVADPFGGTESGADVGVNNPGHYCQPDARMAAPCFVNGDPLLVPDGGCPGGGAPAADFDAFVTFLNTVDSNNGTGVAHVATASDLGSVWGVAWQRSSASLFAAATVKRHSGLGPLPLGSAGSRTGVIYRLSGDLVSENAAVVEAWFNLDDVAGVDTGAEPAGRDLDPCTTVPNYDPAAFDAVGKVGLGDLDISDDGRTLWVVNLFDRTLYELPIGDPPQPPTDAEVTAHPLGGAEPACTGGVFRPWAVKFHDGVVYVGGVCTGENGGTAADLSLHVLAHDADGPVGSFTEIFQAPLDYPRGKVSDSGANEPLGTWRPWIDEWSDITGPLPGAGPFGQTLFPQPILADLEVDVDGSFILGFLDRAGNQLGNRNYQTDGVDTTTFEGVVAGDTLRLCFDPDDGDGNGNPYVLEFAADCPGPGGPTLAMDQNPPQGPGGREYYWTDYYRWDNNPDAPDAGTHQEITLGGLAHRFGSGEIASSAFDPYDDFLSGGVAWMSQALGSRTHSLEIFGQSAGGIPTTFGKAAGIGDLELMCAPAPLELGNRVWCDDGDGVQEGGESPAPGVEVVLTCGGAPVTVTTDAAGQYLFTDAGYFAVNGTPIPRNATCTISIDVPANTPALLAACGGLVIQPTAANSGAGPNPDLNDSDCTDVGGGVVAASVPTGGDGANDHTWDCGFGTASLDFGDAPDPTYPVLLASDGARHVVLPSGNPTLGSTVDVEADGQPTAGHNGDDSSGTPDDEDGVVLPAGFVPGTLAMVQLLGGATGGLVDAWIDWNGDGSWSGAGEQVATGVAVGAGATVPLAVMVPAGAVPGQTCSRFRISSAGGLVPTGQAADGEVEDHLVRVDGPQPALGVAKQVVEVVRVGQSATFRVVYEVRLANFGNVPLSGLQFPVSFATVFADAVAWQLDGVTSLDLTVSPTFDGETDVEVLTGTDTLAVGGMGVVTLAVVVEPGTVAGPYVCSTTATGVSPQGVEVTDVSQDGSEPDPDGNGNPGEGEPTVVEFPLTVLEIPTLGFSGLALLTLLLAAVAWRLLGRRPRRTR